MKRNRNLYSQKDKGRNKTWIVLQDEWNDQKKERSYKIFQSKNNHSLS